MQGFKRVNKYRTRDELIIPEIILLKDWLSQLKINEIKSQ
jgi:hypothetical protein